MKILLISLYGNVNIGNKLQHYALQSVLEEMVEYDGKKNVVDNFVYDIPNRNLNITIFKTLIKQILGILGVQRFKQIKTRNAVLLKVRERRFEEFSKQHIKNQKKVQLGDEILDTSKYDAVVVGSDQVWHNWGYSEKELDYFYLSFAERSKRISYAPSFGFGDFPKQDIDKHKSGLADMRYLSCRDPEMVDMIKALTGRAAFEVLDPTMLISAERWHEFGKKPDYNVPEDYILVYLLGNIPEGFDEEVKYLRSNLTEKTFSIFDPLKEERFLTTPDEFIYLMEHATIILTDSYHATIFSLIFHKNFIVFERKERGMENMFGRIEGLLSNFGMEDQIFRGKITYPKLPDYDLCDVMIQERIRLSKEYLQNALYECADQNRGLP